jgi:hypothetical protein
LVQLTLNWHLAHSSRSPVVSLVEYLQLQLQSQSVPLASSCSSISARIVPHSIALPLLTTRLSLFALVEDYSINPSSKRCANRAITDGVCTQTTFSPPKDPDLHSQLLETKFLSEKQTRERYWSVFIDAWTFVSIRMHVSPFRNVISPVADNIEGERGSVACRLARVINLSPESIREPCAKLTSRSGKARWCSPTVLSVAEE